MSVNQIFLAVDAQVVLTWLLTEDVKTKNIFTRNRLIEIKEMIKNIKENYTVDVLFKYEPSDQNPGDFVTRGISLEKFKQNFTLWTHGPEWLNSNSIVWPLSRLECLSSSNKDKVQTNIFQNSLSDLPSEPVISFDRYSRFGKLVENVEMIFRLRES